MLVPCCFSSVSSVLSSLLIPCSTQPDCKLHPYYGAPVSAHLLHARVRACFHSAINLAVITHPARIKLNHHYRRVWKYCRPFRGFLHGYIGWKESTKTLRRHLFILPNNNKSNVWQIPSLGVLHDSQRCEGCLRTFGVIYALLLVFYSRLQTCPVIGRLRCCVRLFCVKSSICRPICTLMRLGIFKKSCRSHTAVLNLLFVSSNSGLSTRVELLLLLGNLDYACLMLPTCLDTENDSWICTNKGLSEYTHSCPTSFTGKLRKTLPLKNTVTQSVCKSMTHHGKTTGRGSSTGPTNQPLITRTRMLRSSTLTFPGG